VAKAPSLDRFLSAYTAYVGSQIAPSLGQLEKFCEEIKQTDYWEQRSATIYHPDRRSDEKRADPKRHPIPSPVHQTAVRVKYPESTLRKLTTESATYKGFGKAAMSRLFDMLGARIVVYFPHQLTWIDAAIRDHPSLELHPDQKPKSFHDLATLERLGFDHDQFDARNRKTSGYSSLHYILRFREAAVKPPDARPWFELQVRTIAEDLWGEIEHHIGYKPEQRTRFSVQRQFRVISEHLQAVDMHLDFIYDEMQHFQSEFDAKPDEKLNAENLPGVLANLGIRITQDELGPVLDILSAYGVITLDDMNNRGQYETLEHVRSAWRTHLKGVGGPSGLMIVHVVASLPETPKPSRDEIDGRVRAFFELYRTLRDVEPN